MKDDTRCDNGFFRLFETLWLFVFTVLVALVAESWQQMAFATCSF